jgi:hypothetical protein
VCASQFTVWTETGNGKRETGNGKRETGNGKRDSGSEMEVCASSRMWLADLRLLLWVADQRLVSQLVPVGSTSVEQAVRLNSANRFHPLPCEAGEG